MIMIMLSRKLGELRVTQAELAAKTGIRPNTINDLFHNVAERVSLEHLDKICEALDCECVQVIGRKFVLFKQKKKESAYTAVLAK